MQSSNVILYKSKMSEILLLVYIPTINHEKMLRFEERQRDVEPGRKKEVNFNIDVPQFEFPSSSECLLPSTSKGVCYAEIHENKKPGDKEKGDLHKNVEPSSQSNDNIINQVLDDDIINIELPDSKFSMQTILLTVLDHLNIDKVHSTRTINNNFLRYEIPISTEKTYKNVLSLFERWGIGVRLHSDVRIVTCESVNFKNSYFDEKTITDSENEKKYSSVKDTAWTRFVSSMRARLTVAEVVETIRSNATLTFDFLVLLLISTLLSAFGLVENNSIFLVSSMLISPLMAPVIAGTFGTVIQDYSLVKLGIRNELFGLGIATFVGFLYGMMICCIGENRYGETSWPTSEMLSWCTIRTLWIGCIVALVTGVAAALGILGDYMGSLVGVAISASLLPPAVNAGVFWALAMYYSIFGSGIPLSIENVFSKNDNVELALLGACSYCLTLLNIVCIYLAGILVFKIKEVAPGSSKDQTRIFWKHDVRVTRDYNRTLQNEDARNLGKRFAEEVASLTQPSYISNTQDIPDMASVIMEDPPQRAVASDFEEGMNNITWSPGVKTINKKPTIQELQSMYFSFTGYAHRPMKRTLNYGNRRSHRTVLPWRTPTPTAKMNSIFNNAFVGSPVPLTRRTQTKSKHNETILKTPEPVQGTYKRFTVTPVPDPLKQEENKQLDNK